MRNVFATLPMGVVIFSEGEEGTLKYANPKFKELLQ
jgi:hypothetical protein